MIHYKPLRKTMAAQGVMTYTLRFRRGKRHAAVQRLQKDIPAPRIRSVSCAKTCIAVWRRSLNASLTNPVPTNNIWVILTQ